MKEYLTALLSKHQYTEQDSRVLIDTLDAITHSPLSRQWDDLMCFYDERADYSVSDGLDAIRKVRVIANELELHRYTVELLLFLCMSKTLKRRYDERGLSDEMFNGVLDDMRYKVTECKLIHGIVGSFVADWFIGFFTLNRFSFGRLQFELMNLKQDYVLDGLSLARDESVINVHIPRTGTPLSPQECEAAYAKGAAFFKEKLDGKIVFHCSSWLLYPEHENFLPSHSNVLTFARRYTLIDHGEYGDEFASLWRIFDTQYDGNPDNLPNNSSLRRAYIQRLKEGKSIGWGAGVFRY